MPYRVLISPPFKRSEGRVRICKRLRSPGINSKESVPPAYVAWRAGTSTRARICKPFWSPEIDSRPGGPVQQPYLTYRPAGLHRLAESLPRNRFLASINVYKYGLWVVVPTRQAGNRFLGSLNGLQTRTQVKKFERVKYPPPHHALG